MKKLLLASAGTALLFTSLSVLHAETELNDCLEMYCPYGCDAKNPKTNAPRCCREDEHIVNGHCECIKGTCGDVCYDPDTQCCVNGVVTGKDHPIKKKVEGVCQEVMACPDETDECTPCTTTCGSCEYCNDTLNVGQCEADTNKEGSLVGDCGICSNGVVLADATKYNTTCQSCTEETNWYKSNNNVSVGDCGICSDGVVVADSSKYNTVCQTCSASNNWFKLNVTNGNNVQPTGECCVDGALGYSATYCPQNCTKCGVGNELSGQAFNFSTMLTQNSCQCICNEDAGYHLHRTSDGSYKCLPYCTKNTGIFLLVDRSGSTFSKKGASTKCDNAKDPCTKINKLLKGLKLSDRNYALYNEETGGCGYNVAMSMLTFGHHTSSSYNLWKDIEYKPKCNDSSGTYFDKALAHIYSKYCKKDQPIVLMIITDGEIQERKKDMTEYMNSMINRCDATIIYVGPDSSDLKKSMNKYMSHYYAYGFDSDVQSWIDATNNAANDSCIPTNDSKRTPSTSDSSWFCNVLNNSSSGKNTYLHLTKDQCFSCPSNVKFRWHKEQNKWGDVGVCCGTGQDKNVDACKTGSYSWDYK